MNELKNTFLAGKMNKDIDSRLMPDGQYRDALNIKLNQSGGSDVGAVENMLSAEQLTTLSLGTTVNTVGAYFDNSADMIYWFVTSDLGDYVVEYNTITDTPVIVLEDTSASVLNFNINNLITGVGLLVDSDNGRRILVWTDDLNPIRTINIATAKAYAPNGFTNAQISLIKAPPLAAPTLALTNTASDEENNMSERFLRFAHRYRYADGEISCISPFTETAFSPKNFVYDYATSSNESMVNLFNQADIGFNTGVAEVVKIDILMKESNSNTVYLIESFDKAEEGWADSTTQSFSFTNNKIYVAIPEDQLERLYDAVPLKAKALELIGNRIILGNYTEGYNITTGGGADIKIDFALDVVSTAVTLGNASSTMKSIRDYEVGIVYLDDFGRMSTILTSPDNTAFIPNSDSINQNELRVTLTSIPPSWATRYRFFLKQTRVDYDTIIPAAFYQDGVFVWIKVEGDEAAKFDVGDFLYVKADSSSLLQEAVQTRVLEVVQQPNNFLELSTAPEVPVIQQSGTYFKIKPSGFRLNEDDFIVFNSISFGFRSGATANDFVNDTLYYVEPEVYYGTLGFNDITVTGTYTGLTDIRYLIDINVLGLPDQFRWSDDNGSTWSADTPITGAAQAMNNGLSVTFGNTTGHLADDNWVVSAKSGQVTIDVRKSEAGGTAGTNARRAIIHYAGKATTDTGGESIKGGAQITIHYDDTPSEGAAGIAYSQTFTSTAQYANIEEWFYGDNIINTLTYPTITELDRVIFRRGDPSKPNVNGFEQVTIDTAANQICMCFMSSTDFSGGERMYVNQFSTPSLEILELNNSIVFETKPLNVDDSFFFEIGRTYDITGGFHIGFGGGDQNQTGGQDAILVLPTFNAFCWGNGFESYKVRDLFNESTMGIDTRPSLPIEDYRENVRIADLTYSKTFEQSTNFNGINEFNLSTANFLLMDDRYGSIQKLFSADTNLEVYQEDKVHYVLYQKDVLTDADGNQNIRESSNVLGNTPIPWTGEYGISTHPESHAFYGNKRYFTDVRRGVILRRSQDGLTEIQSGMSDFLRDAFRLNFADRKFGAYDLHDEEYVLYDESNYTVGYDDKIKGFPSFYSFQPQWMGSLNNEFYSFSGGQLYKHYDETNPVRNNFYGVNYDSTIKLIVSQGPSDIKVLKNIVLEGNKAWSATIKSYLNDEIVDVTQSTIAITEYLNKEGKFYGYVRRNEIAGDLTAKNAYGIGEIASIASLVVTMSAPLPTSVSIGDEIYDSTPTLVGTITAIDTTLNTITLSSVGSLSPTDFIIGQKDGRIEGSEIRGYNFEIDLVDDTNLRTELFALNSNIFKSWPS